MSSFFGAMPSQEDLEFDGFFDGQKKIIPDNTELTALVTGGFSGVEEGKAQQIFKVDLVITSPGEFYGQAQTYNARVYDLDASKRDRAKQNLAVIDVQAGLPMHNAGLQSPTTEDIENMWAGKAHVRIKMGYGTKLEMEDQPDPSSPSGRKTVEVLKEFNWIRGFGYLREKMLPAVDDRDAERRDIASEQDAPGAECQGTPVDSGDDIGF